MFEAIASALLYLIIFITFTLFIVGLIALWMYIFIGLPTALIAVTVFGIAYGIYTIAMKQSLKR